MEDIYRKVTQIEHILLRPDTYIGSIETNDQELWVIQDGRFSNQTISYCQGLYKIFDEILVNAADNYQRDKTTDRISVTITRDTITVENSGKGIPVQMHKDHKIWIPEMIFGHLLTSSNYDDSVQKVTGGRNGFGAKLTNIFSKQFRLETADKNKRFTMTWFDNMSRHTEPEIVSNNGPQFTRITFTPDVNKFKVQNLDEIRPLLEKRVYDMAGILPITVTLNDKKLPINNFRDYANLYNVQKCVYTSQQRWDVLVSASDGQFQQVSFVNAIATIRGGTHVNHVADQIIEGILSSIKKKHKEMKNLKPFQVRNFLKIFVNCLIVNPAFDSQTKETLTTKAAQFGSKFDLPDKVLDDIIKKTDIVDNVILSAKSKLNKQLQKQLSGKKQSRLLGIEKLEDANDAGTPRADQCTLILTEGDSAKSLAMAGIETVGRDKFGVFPLKGKLLNVRDATVATIMKNSEIEQLVKIMGLQFNKNYDNVKSLRYGSIMIMTDQDHDGHHIKGLIINFIDKFWPSLLKMKGFLKQFVTPIIKISRNAESHSFFSIGDYKKFIESRSEEFKVKYYKGLGTSTDQEAQQYFSNLALHRKVFTYGDETDREAIDLAFSKTRADQRKDWLTKYSWNEIMDTLDYSKATVRYRDFINDCLAMHSISDNFRSIPSLQDGLKPTQRKIMHTLLNHSKIEYKVSSLAGLTTSYAQYHHGEASLQGTIVAMAQNFTGANNVNLLLPIGQFGTRAMAGKDAAQARYISTKLSPLAIQLFNEDDLHVLRYLEEEGHTVEPNYFMPLLPLVLLNGADGIGTGWSTNIPQYNPRELCEAIRNRMRGKPFEELVPWFKGFTGDIIPQGASFVLKGNYIRHKDRVYITEIPVRKSVKEYQQFLQQKMEGETPEVLDLREYHAGNKVCFEVKLSEEALSQDLEKFLKLSSSLTLSNLVLFDSRSAIHRYESIVEILDEFYALKIENYRARKEYLISKYQNELYITKSKFDFIDMAIDTKLRGLKKLDMCKKLEQLGFRGLNKFQRIKSTRIFVKEDTLEKQYDYLLSMPIWSFSEEKIQQLKDRIAELEQTIAALDKKSAEELWEADIVDFLKCLDKQESIEMEETFKRVEKNVEKLVKGGSKLLKSILTQKECQLEVSEDSSDEEKDVNVLTKVVAEFAKFGIDSRRAPIKLEKRAKQEQPSLLQKYDQIEVESAEVNISDIVESDSPKQGRQPSKAIKQRESDSNEKQQQPTKRNKSSSQIESKPQKQQNNKMQFESSDSEKEKKPKRLKQRQIEDELSDVSIPSVKDIIQKPTRQRQDQVKQPIEATPIKQASTKKNIKAQNKDSEKGSKSKIQDDILNPSQFDPIIPKQPEVKTLTPEEELYIKYGLGDFLNYLKPSTPTPILNEPVQKENKHQNEQKTKPTKNRKLRQNSESDVDEMPRKQVQK